jgi:hypothetical protein
MVQVAPAAILVPQVFAGDLKSVFAAAGTPPEIATLVNAMAVVVLLLTVTICVAVGVPINCGPNVRLEGDTVRVGWKVSSATKASDGPFSAAWNAPGLGTTGKVAADDAVTPAMTALFETGTTAMALTSSIVGPLPLPPK